ncbi:ATP-binding protein [Streptomyces sp. NBC_00019]|uniref:ATP-binding protein n=1 Tax=Streptomyces sp. NBC_00019 TaxID=2975623 RepID=UPI0032556E37
MTTTAVRALRTAPNRGGDVLNERIRVASRHGDDPPHAEDACRVGIMRRIAAARLRYCGLEALHDDVMLIVSELLTNALLHSGTTQISLNITVENESLRIAVGDGMPGCAEPKPADDDAEAGRGLALVENLVQANGGTWGTSDAGATTWARLNLPVREEPHPDHRPELGPPREAGGSAVRSGAAPVGPSEGSTVAAVCRRLPAR